MFRVEKLAKNIHSQEAESEEELTDDEVFLQRHSNYEQEEVKRYNIGLDKKH